MAEGRERVRSAHPGGGDRRLRRREAVGRRGGRPRCSPKPTDSAPIIAQDRSVRRSRRDNLDRDPIGCPRRHFVDRVRRHRRGLRQRQLLGRADRSRAGRAVRSVSARTRRLASVCTGSFVLAQAGLLDGQRATTHWHDARVVARAFPRCPWNRTRSSSATATCSPRLGCRRASTWRWRWSKWITGRELVRSVARWLVVYLKRAGGPIAILGAGRGRPAAGVRRCAAVIDAIAANPGADHSVGKLCGPGEPEHPAADPAVSVRAGDEPGTLRRIGANRLRPWRHSNAGRIRHRDRAHGRLRQHRNA